MLNEIDRFFQCFPADTDIFLEFVEALQFEIFKVRGENFDSEFSERMRL